MSNIGMINVPSKVGRDAWQKCWMIMMQACVVFGMNETLYPNMKAVYAAIAKKNGWAYAGLWDSPNPIFWDKSKFRKHWHKTVKLHRARRGLRYPGFRSARFANCTVLTSLSTKLKTLHINVHLAAFNNDKVPNEWVQRMHERSLAKIEELVQAGLDQGIDVYLYGDFNIHELLKFKGVKGRYEIIKGRGVDKMYHFRPLKEGQKSGAKFEHDTLELDAPTDHKHGIVAKAA